MTQIKVQTKLEMPLLSRLFVPGLDNFVKETIEEAARAWVRAALDIIPTWSGASRATLQSLADAVREPVPINIAATAPDRIALGRLYSRGGIEKKGRAKWNFYYETTLSYLIANETSKVAPRTNGLRGSLITPTPYKFREAGNRAAQAVINQRMEKLPPLAKLFVKKKL